MNQNIGYDEYIIPYLFSMVLEHAEKKILRTLKPLPKPTFYRLIEIAFNHPPKSSFPYLN
jgi:hypothetical protein